MALTRVSPGQPFRPSARTWNTFVDAARALQAGKLDQAIDLDLPRLEQSRLLIINSTGSELRRYSIVGIGEPWQAPAEDLDQFKRQIVFHGVIPGDQCRQGFAVLLEPLLPGDVGEAAVAGVAIAQVDVIRESDPFVEAQPGNVTSLRSSSIGRSRILWKEPGTGLRWCVLHIADRPKFAVFQLGSSRWLAGDADEPSGWAKMPDCKPVLYFAGESTYRPDEDEPHETIWHAVGYPPGQRDELQSLHQATGLFPGRYGEGDWVWCFWNDHECRWQMLASYEDHWRFKLVDPLSRCGSARANLVLNQDGRFCPVDLTFTIVDSIGIRWPHEQPGSSAGMANIPHGTFGIARHFADSQAWEVIALGEGCCPGSSSSSGSSNSAQNSASSLGQSEKSSSPSSAQSAGFSGEPSSESPASKSSPRPCIGQIGDLRFEQIPGYTSSGRQVLFHNNGCLEWITIRSCEEPSSGSAAAVEEIPNQQGGEQ